MAHGHENCIPLNRRSKEVQRKIQQKGRDTNKANWEKIKGLRDTVKAVLGDTITDKEGKEIPIAVAITVAQVKKALKGDVRAFKALAEIVCDKQQKVDMTNSDGSLTPLDIKVEFIKAQAQQDE